MDGLLGGCSGSRQLSLTKRRSTDATVGVWATASRQRVRVYSSETGRSSYAGRFRQVSRLANPLFNEVIVPMAFKDRWNADSPYEDNKYAKYVAKPELAGLLPVLYPGVFPNLAASPSRAPTCSPSY